MSDPNENRPGYKETKVGWIPGEWSLENLGSLVTIQSGGTPSKAENDYWGGEIPWFCARDLKSFRLNGSVNTVTEEGSKNGTRTIPRGTILVLVRGMMLNRDFPVGVTAQPACFNQDLKALTANETRCSTDFLAYSLVASKKRFLSQVDRSSHGTGKLQTEVLKSAPILLPPLPEQKKVADILSTCDEAIEKTGALIEAKQRQKKALMQQLLTGKKRLPGFDQEWYEAKLHDICTRLTKVADDPEGYPVLSITAGKGFVSQQDKFSRVIAGKQVEKYVVLKRGQFSYNKGNSYRYPQGCVYQLEEYEEGLVPNVFYSFEVHKDRVDSEFLKQYFLAGLHNKDLYRWINSGVRNNGLLNLNASDFFNLPLSLPSLNEQQLIGSVLKDADSELRLLEARLSALNKQKKALMQKLLTGQIRVTV